jgi:SNF2 family DNA or RNA helicase
MNVLMYHDPDGGSESRELIRLHEWYFDNPKYARFGITKFNVLLTTSHALLSDWMYFQPIRWRYVIVDEAHNLKNSESQLASHIKVRGLRANRPCSRVLGFTCLRGCVRSFRQNRS